jgi:hypothetical protein
MLISSRLDCERSRSSGSPVVTEITAVPTTAQATSRYFGHPGLSGHAGVAHKDLPFEVGVELGEPEQQSAAVTPGLKLAELHEVVQPAA